MEGAGRAEGAGPEQGAASAAASAPPPPGGLRALWDATAAQRRALVGLPGPSPRPYGTSPASRRVRRVLRIPRRPGGGPGAGNGLGQAEPMRVKRGKCALCWSLPHL